MPFLYWHVQLPSHSSLVWWEIRESDAVLKVAYWVSGWHRESQLDFCYPTPPNRQLNVSIFLQNRVSKVLDDWFFSLIMLFIFNWFKITNLGCTRNSTLIQSLTPETVCLSVWVPLIVLHWTSLGFIISNRDDLRDKTVTFSAWLWNITLDQTESMFPITSFYFFFIQIPKVSSFPDYTVFSLCKTF